MSADYGRKLAPENERQIQEGMVAATFQVQFWNRLKPTLVENILNEIRNCPAEQMTEVKGMVRMMDIIDSSLRDIEHKAEAATRKK